MKLSVTSWSFPQCNLTESTGLSNLLGINAIDVGYFYRSALDKNTLLEDYKKIIKNKYPLLNTLQMLSLMLQPNLHKEPRIQEFSYKVYFPAEEIT